eukprot:g2775.t1
MINTITKAEFGKVVNRPDIVSIFLEAGIDIVALLRDPDSWTAHEIITLRGANVATVKDLGQLKARERRTGLTLLVEELHQRLQVLETASQRYGERLKKHLEQLKGERCKNSNVAVDDLGKEVLSAEKRRAATLKALTRDARPRPGKKGEVQQRTAEYEDTRLEQQTPKVDDEVISELYPENDADEDNAETNAPAPEHAEKEKTPENHTTNRTAQEAVQKELKAVQLVGSSKSIGDEQVFNESNTSNASEVLNSSNDTEVNDTNESNFSAAVFEQAHALVNVSAVSEASEDYHQQTWITDQKVRLQSFWILALFVVLLLFFVFSVYREQMKKHTKEALGKRSKDGGIPTVDGFFWTEQRRGGGTGKERESKSNERQTRRKEELQAMEERALASSFDDLMGCVVDSSKVMIVVDVLTALIPISNIDVAEADERSVVSSSMVELCANWHDTWMFGSICVLIVFQVVRAVAAMGHHPYCVYGRWAWLMYLGTDISSMGDTVAILLSGWSLLCCRAEFDQAWSLYYVVNSTNSASQWEYVGVIKYTDGVKTQSQWQRFESIPSSMFFALLTLNKKNPLAHVFVTWYEKLLVIFVNICCVPLFSLVSSMIGGSIMKLVLSEAPPAEGAREQPSEAAGDEVAELEDDEDDTADGADDAVMALLGFGSVFCYGLSTSKREMKWLFFTVHKLPHWAFPAVDGVVGALFLADWLHSAVSPAAEVPPQADAAVADAEAELAQPEAERTVVVVAFGPLEGEEARRFNCLCCLWRIYLLEKWLDHPFQSALDALHTCRKQLVTTGAVTIFFWLLGAHLLFFTEFENPDKYIRKFYGSVLRAIWVTSFFLNGEWVFCDFSWMGKAVGGFIVLFGVSIVVVPMTVFTGYFLMNIQGDFYETQVQYLKAEPGDLWQLKMQPSAEAYEWQKKLFKLLPGTMALVWPVFQLVILSLLRRSAAVCEGDALTCKWEEESTKCVEAKCQECQGERCQLCREDSKIITECCNDHSEMATIPSLCELLGLNVYMEDMCQARHFDCFFMLGREGVYFHNVQLPAICGEGHNHDRGCESSPTEAERLTCRWTAEVNHCMEGECGGCEVGSEACKLCREDAAKISACCDQHHHNAATPRICADAILTVDVKSCVAETCKAKEETTDRQEERHGATPPTVGKYSSTSSDAYGGT